MDFRTFLPFLVMFHCHHPSFELPWVKPDSLNRGLPASIQIYTLNTTTSPFSSKLTGGFARFSMNDTNLEFVVKDTNGDALGYFPKTPM
jgi:hypothetical protein